MLDKPAGQFREQLLDLLPLTPKSQEAVDAVLGAFLLPSRELRAQRAVRQRPAGFNLVHLCPHNRLGLDHFVQFFGKRLALRLRPRDFNLVRLRVSHGYIAGDLLAGHTADCLLPSVEHLASCQVVDIEVLSLEIK